MVILWLSYGSLLMFDEALVAFVLLEMRIHVHNGLRDGKEGGVAVLFSGEGRTALVG